MSLKIQSLLIINDEKDLVEMVSDVAEKYFETVHLAFDGNQAVDVLKDNEINLILCDISMVAMNGDIFLKKIRLMGNPTPIVFITSSSTKNVAIDALKLGAAYFLEKPFKTEHLVQFLNLTIELENHRKKIAELKPRHRQPVTKKAG